MSDTQRTTIKYTNQEVFNLVAFHLFTQGERSCTIHADVYKCKYRGPRGLKCAVGALISDSRYKSDFEGWKAGKIIKEHLSDMFADVNLDLVNKLQLTHDMLANWDNTGQMQYALKNIANLYALDATILDNLSFKDR